MSNHPNRSRRTTMTRMSYEAMARKLRHYADLIEANAERATPEQRRTLTQAINGLPSYASAQYRRHNGITNAEITGAGRDDKE